MLLESVAHFTLYIAYSKCSGREIPGSSREKYLNYVEKYISIIKTHDLIVDFVFCKQNGESATECASAPVDVEGGGGLFNMETHGRWERWIFAV